MTLTDAERERRFPSDAALLLFCVAHGKARSCPFSGVFDGHGEVAVGGIRHCVTIGHDGTPDIGEGLRSALQKAAQTPDPRA